MRGRWWGGVGRPPRRRRQVLSAHKPACPGVHPFRPVWGNTVVVWCGHVGRGGIKAICHSWWWRRRVRCGVVGGRRSHRSPRPWCNRFRERGCPPTTERKVRLVPWGRRVSTPPATPARQVETNSANPPAGVATVHRLSGTSSTVGWQGVITMS